MHVSVDYILVSTCIIIFLVAWHMSYAPRLLKNQKLIIELLQKCQQWLLLNLAARHLLQAILLKTMNKRIEK